MTASAPVTPKPGSADHFAYSAWLDGFAAGQGDCNPWESNLTRFWEWRSQFLPETPDTPADASNTPPPRPGG